MPSLRVMVKSCVGGGREESFFEHPDAVRIVVCGFLCADFLCGFFMRILRADFRADFGFFFVRISVRIFTRTFFGGFFWQGDRRESDKKILPKNPPQNPPQNPLRILPEYLPGGPPLDSKNHGCAPGCPLPSPTSQCSSFWQLFAVVDAGLAGWSWGRLSWEKSAPAKLEVSEMQHALPVTKHARGHLSGARCLSRLVSSTLAEPKKAPKNHKKNPHCSLADPGRAIKTYYRVNMLAQLIL